jgi:hypothetical protein
MSFSLANPTGWTTGDTLTETQINQLDAEHAAAIDGSGGGSYSLTNPLNILGDTVTFDDIVATNANIDYVIAPDALIGDLIVSATTSLVSLSCSSFLTVTGDVNLNGNVNLGNASGDNVAIYGTCSVNNDFYIGETSGDTCTVASTTLLNGPVTVSGIVGYSGTGRTRETGTAPSITGATVSFDSFRHILIMSTATTPATFTITGTDANGEWFILQNDSSAAHTIASALFTGFTLPANSGVKMLRFSGVWFVVQRWT